MANMINSKAINPGFVKGLKLPLSDKEEKELSPLSKKFKDIVEKISSFRIGGWRIGYTFKILDDVGEWGLKRGMEYTFDRWLDAVTFSQFRYQFGLGWDYFKRGFKSCDFDSASALEDFIWKLERLGKHIKRHDIHEGADKDSERIAETVRLLKRFMADEYLDEFEKEVAEKYGDDIRYEARTTGCFGFFNKGKGPFKGNSATCTMTLHRREKWTPENHYEIAKAERAMYRKAHTKRMKEWHKALTIIEKHLLEWWD
jgi:hypothetical protein